MSDKFTVKTESPEPQRDGQCNHECPFHRLPNTKKKTNTCGAGLGMYRNQKVFPGTLCPRYEKPTDYQIGDIVLILGFPHICRIESCTSQNWFVAKTISDDVITKTFDAQFDRITERYRIGG